MNYTQSFGGEALEEREGPVFYHSMNIKSEIR
jgi:hypothetical protein